MSNPDFSQSPQHVALAKVMYEAIGQDFDKAIAIHQRRTLAMADAAMTHLGSGYVLPPATEANAERLARAVRKVKMLPAEGLLWSAWKREALDYLCALPAAFGNAEKHEPVFLTPQQADELEEAAQKRKPPLGLMPKEHWQAQRINQITAARVRYEEAGMQVPSEWLDELRELEEAARIAADPTYCREGCDKPFGHFGQHSDEDAATYGKEEGPDFAAEAEERERKRLMESFMVAIVGNPAVMAKMLESHEGDEAMIAAAVADMAQHLAQELIG